MSAAGRLPDEVADFRRAHRERHIGPRYRGWAHLGFTTCGALAAIVFAAIQVDRPSALELASVPLFFLVANFGEYLGHRGPMHHRRKGLSILFERHARQHHRFYTHEAMAAESHVDFQMVLFPPVMLIFFLGCLALPIGALLHVLVAPNVGWLFALTAVSYFLTYEWLHFAYHLPPDGRIGRNPIVRRLRRHHAVHHDPRQMTRWNFNITFPIADRVFGTIAPQASEARDRSASPAYEETHGSQLDRLRPDPPR
jgi:sterol desaturase/sphingolipid hydroxylase (fatty acid hydroxylase superfamily)